MLDFAGLCGTMLDHAGPFAGHAGHDGRSRMTDRCTIQKSGLLLVEIGGHCPPLPLLPGRFHSFILSLEVFHFTQV
jgi:hypothetical protein